MKRDVSIAGIQYPVQVVGTGDVPCLCIGLGTLLVKTLSDNFKKMFKLYSTDLYFNINDRRPDIRSLTMEALAAHVLEVIDQLGLVRPVIIAHSCFGILAIEVAKQNESKLRGLILVASAPQWNKASILQTEQYFLKHAEPERIKNDAYRKQKYSLSKKPSDSELSIEKYISDSARYFGNFEVSEEEIYSLWEEITVDEEVVNQFFETTLPQHDLRKGIANVKLPILLLAGERDYDSLPLIQWSSFQKPSNFLIANCGNVGHWPQVESPEIFDNYVREWLLYCGRDFITAPSLVAQL